MPKILCVVSLAVSALVFLLFALDLVIGIPFGRVEGTLVTSLGIMVGAAIIGTFSYLTISECK